MTKREGGRENEGRGTERGGEGERMEGGRNRISVNGL